MLTMAMVAGVADLQLAKMTHATLRTQTKHDAIDNPLADTGCDTWAASRDLVSCRLDGGICVESTFETLPL
jgi:hypothetical protein